MKSFSRTRVAPQAVRTLASTCAFTFALGISAAEAQAQAPPTPPPPPTAAATIARTAGRPLTSNEVATRAENTSAEVQTRRAEVDIAAAQLDAAFVGYFPRLTGNARYTRLSDIDPQLLGYGVGAVGVAPNGLSPVMVPAGTQLVQAPLVLPVVLNNYTFQGVLAVPISDYLFRTVQNYSAAEKTRDAAEHQTRAARLKARAEGRVLYFTWARATLSRDVASQAVEQAKAHLADVKSAFDAGGASNADVMRVESQVASAEQLEARAKNLVQLLASQLRTIMHEEGEGAFAIGEDVTTDLVAPPLKPLGDLAADAATRRPELKALAASEIALEKQMSATKSLAYPRLDAQGEVTSANPNPRYFPPQEKFNTTWSVTAQLTWTPNDIFNAGAAAKGLDAKRSLVEAQRRGLIDALRNEVAQAIEATENASSAQRTSVRSQSAAEESYRVRRSLFLNGRSTSVELTDAEIELTRARLDVIGARIEARIASIRYRHAMGLDVE